MKKTVLRKYARLIAVMGVSIKKGDEVIIQCELDCPDFIKILTEECYRAGAAKVRVEFSFQPLTAVHVKYRTLDALSAVENWEEEKMKHYADTLPARIYILSEDPDGLSGMDQQKHSKGYAARYKVMKPYIDSMDGKYKWCIAAVPGKAWAKKVFPELSASKAVERLWDAILYTSRAGEGENPIENWKRHNEQMHSRCDYLNSLGIKELIYSASNGTNLTVGLIENSHFCGASEKTPAGEEYNPNIPSEECFISPMRGKADGTVFSSKPLSYRGELIENFSITFKDGRAVDCKAEKNEELLKTLIGMDDGSAFLGECALVPYDSPINKSGILFYNTLFDENAACHLALGRGFTECIDGHEQYSLEEMHKMGINDSMIHEDFMIGTKDLSISAKCTDGRTVQIFENGNWAF